MRRSNPPDADIIALKGLAFLAGSQADLEQFLAISGLRPDDIRARAGDPHFLAGVLDFFLSGEALLLAFCEAETLDPREVHRASAILSGGTR